MGVYIPDVKMPKDCKSCMFSGFGGILNELTVCSFTGIGKELMNYGERFNDCPLIEISIPHGRLVDEKELKKKLNYYGFRAPDMTIHELIEDELTTVIEAEE